MFLRRTLHVLSVLIVITRPAASQTVVSTIPAGSNPIRVAVNAVTNRIYTSHATYGVPESEAGL